MLLASGCAVQDTRTTLPGGQQPSFSVAGKFAIKQGEQGYSARFTWQQLRDSYAIEVWGPLGQGRTSLVGDVDRMKVRRGDKLLADGAPEEVMDTALGWSIPIQVLPAWISGAPHNQFAYQDARLDDKGRYIMFNQAGWQVQLERYTQNGQHSTPGRVIARSGIKKVTVIVRSFAQ